MGPSDVIDLEHRMMRYAKRSAIVLTLASIVCGVCAIIRTALVISDLRLGSQQCVAAEGVECIGAAARALALWFAARYLGDIDGERSRAGAETMLRAAIALFSIAFGASLLFWPVAAWGCGASRMGADVLLFMRSVDVGSLAAGTVLGMIRKVHDYVRALRADCDSIG